MKKVIASAGLVALGTAGLQAAYAPGMSSMETSKNWNVSLAVRAFYDDNYLTLDDKKVGVPPKDPVEDSFGFELRPTINLNFPMEQTLLKFGYTYSAKYYEARDEDEWDQAHLVNFLLDHSFSPSARVTVTDAFVYANEPDLVDGGAVQRSEQNNIRNQADLNFYYQFTDQLGTVVGYRNTIVDYDQDGPGSYSAQLDRMEHLFTLNLRWQAFPQTVLVFGYNFGIVGYTGDDFISPGFKSDDRDNTSHAFYFGTDHTFTPNLTLSTRLGAQYTDVDNENAGGDTDWSPYGDTSLNWTYMAGSSLTVGVRSSRTATDVIAQDANGEITSDAQTFAGYVSVLHAFTPDFSANGMISVQNSTFNGGFYDEDSEMIVTAGLGVTYQFNQYFAAEAGYNFDTVDSDVPGRDYKRNRVFVGLKASY